MKKRVLFLSDFTIDNLSNIFISNDIYNEFDLIEPPSNNFINSILDIENPIWTNLYFCKIWCSAESIIPEINNSLDKSKITEEYLNESIDNFSENLKKISKKVGMLFIASFTYNIINYETDFLSMKDNGLSYLLLKMNLRLVSNLNEIDNIFILNTDKWIKSIGKKSYNLRSWYRAKIPFSNEVFIEASKEILSAIRANQNLNKKLLILDLDNTLWGGVIGEDGIDKIDLGGHSEIGEAFVDFQKSILNYKHRGVLLAINSKNNESDAFEAIEKHPEMVLKKNDFITHRINWKNKEENIVSIVDELNLGLDSVVFIDDSEIERNRVANSLPEVYVPNFPKSPFELSAFLNSMNCFDKINLTLEDLKRSEMYADEKARKVAKNSMKNEGDWIASLEIKIEAMSLNKNNLKRCVQLLNKTNQMNLSTRRMIESDFVNWSSNETNNVYTINVSDRFGNYGLTGILSTTKNKNCCDIIDFVISCRALGRKVEDAMMYIASEKARLMGCDEVSLEFKETKKNLPCQKFLKNNELLIEEVSNIFKFNPQNYSKPENIDIIQI